MALTHNQKQHFYEHGYVHIPGVVPQLMVEAAVKAINHSLGEGIDPEQVVIYRSRSFCPELQREPVITQLLTHTPAWALAEALVGAGKLNPVTGGQIALRFPGFQDPPPPPHPHLDGMHTKHNGVPEGEIRNFTMLLGVALSDLPAPNSGNFTVWPGTHHQYEQYFRQREPAALLEGMPPINLPEPKQLLAKAGDVMLVHYQLAHAAAPNVSPYPRYAIYFRLKHQAHDNHNKETLTDIWLDWEGMQDLVAANKAKTLPVA